MCAHCHNLWSSLMLYRVSMFVFRYSGQLVLLLFYELWFLFLNYGLFLSLNIPGAQKSSAANFSKCIDLHWPIENSTQCSLFIDYQFQMSHAFNLCCNFHLYMCVCVCCGCSSFWHFCRNGKMWATFISKMWTFTYRGRKKMRALINSVFVFYYSIWFTFKYWPSTTTTSSSDLTTEPEHIQWQCATNVHLIAQTAILSALWSICQVYSNSKIYAFEMKAIEKRRKTK